MSRAWWFNAGIYTAGAVMCAALGHAEAWIFAGGAFASIGAALRYGQAEGDA